MKHKYNVQSIALYIETQDFTIIHWSNVMYLTHIQFPIYYAAQNLLNVFDQDRFISVEGSLL